MLLRFRVSNFLSFNDTQEFTLVAGKPRRKMNHLFMDRGVNILRFSAVYGANASGKSNLVKAMQFGQEWILGEWRLNSKEAYCKIREENRNKPSTFEYDIKIGDKYYSYGFSTVLSKKQIREEWLFEMGVEDNEESILLFSREYNPESETYTTTFDDKRFSPESRTVLDAYVEGVNTKTKQLFLTSMDQENTGVCKKYPELDVFFKVNDWFHSTLSIVTPHSTGLDGLIDEFTYKNKLSIKMFNLDEFRDFLKVLGLGINDVRISSMTQDEIKRLYFLDSELEHLISDANEKEQVKLKYKKCKEEIKRLTGQIQDMEDSINSILESFNGNVPRLEEVRINIRSLETELKQLHAHKNALETEAADTPNETYLSVIRTIEDKNKRLQEMRQTVRNMMNIESFKNKEAELKDRVESKRKELDVLTREIDVHNQSSLPGNTSDKSYLIHNPDTIILYTPKGIDEDPDIKKIEFGHGKNNIFFDLSEESDGTKRIIELLEILWAVKNDAERVFIVDEVDRSLHPDLTRNMIETFLESLSRESETQLVVTTHESRIMDLDLLRQDEIWFVDKNAEGFSTLYSLEQYDERYDKKIAKAYFEGRYGAVPLFNVFFPISKHEQTIESQNKP